MVLDCVIMDPNTSKSLNFTITNSGNGTLSGTLSSSVGWLSLNQTTINSNNMTVAATVNTTSIGVGQQHTGTISITSNGGNANITITVTPTCVYVCPNPANNTIRFWGSGVPYSTIKIYTISGKLVRTLHEVAGSDALIWDITNTENKKLASGVYLYRISNPKEKNEGKLAIIR